MKTRKYVPKKKGEHCFDLHYNPDGTLRISSYLLTGESIGNSGNAYSIEGLDDAREYMKKRLQLHPLWLYNRPVALKSEAPPREAAAKELLPEELELLALKLCHDFPGTDFIVKGNDSPSGLYLHNPKSRYGEGPGV